MVKPVILAVDDDPQVLRADSGESALDYYLQKSCDPPDQKLYPSLDGLLTDWRADYRPPFERLPLDVGTRNGG